MLECTEYRLSDLDSRQIALVSSNLSTRSQFDKVMCVCVQFFSMQEFMLTLSKLLQRAETPMPIKCICGRVLNKRYCNRVILPRGMQLEQKL